MLVSNWLSHPPIGVGLVVVALLVATGLNNHYREAGRADYAAAQEQRKAQPIIPPGQMPEGVAANDKTPSEHERTYRDLQAQESMAWWARWITIVTGVGVALLAATLYETRGAGQSAAEILTQTRRQADIATETAQFELRAYLSVIPQGVDQLIRRPYGLGLVAVRNVGKLPARDVVVFVCWDESDDHDRKHFVFPEDDRSATRVIQPGAEMRQGSKSKIPLNSACGGSKAFIYVWGVAYYDDSYGCRRFTRFCHRYNTASHNRTVEWKSEAHETRTIINTDKARYHPHGNEAD